MKIIKKMRKLGKRYNKSSEAAESCIRFVESDPRYNTYKEFFEFLNYEKIEGDILEFGVYTGKTLASFSWLNSNSAYKDDLENPRNFYGFDSFKGLTNDSEGHERWGEGSCTTVDQYHPFSQGEPVSEEIVFQLFDYLNLNRPTIFEGLYENSLKNGLPKVIKKAALIHIDCDQFEPTCLVLNNIFEVLQTGTLLVFDDWYHYRGDATKGQSRACQDFLNENKNLKLIDYKNFATFRRSFIVNL